MHLLSHKLFKTGCFETYQFASVSLLMLAFLTQDIGLVLCSQLLTLKYIFDDQTSLLHTILDFI